MRAPWTPGHLSYAGFEPWEREKPCPRCGKDLRVRNRRELCATCREDPQYAERRRLAALRRAGLLRRGVRVYRKKEINGNHSD
jgi:hypothetical protein